MVGTLSPCVQCLCTPSPLELCLVDDVSSSAAVQVVEDWLPLLQAGGVQVVLIRYIWEVGIITVKA